MAGLTTTGITIKSVDDVLSDIESAELANIDPDLNVGPDDVLGQLNGIVAANLFSIRNLTDPDARIFFPILSNNFLGDFVPAMKLCMSVVDLLGKGK